MMTASNISTTNMPTASAGFLGAGGIGALFLLAQRIELCSRIYDRDPSPCSSCPSALPRIRPCPEHRAEISPRRRPSHGTSRAAPRNDRGLPRCGSGPIASPTRPPPATSADAFPRGRHVLNLMDTINGARAAGSWRPASPPKVLRGRRSWRPTAASCPATQGSARRDGLRLRRPVWIPSAADLAGQHLRAAVPAQSERQLRPSQETGGRLPG